jgi:hypothetical protein
VIKDGNIFAYLNNGGTSSIETATSRTPGPTAGRRTFQTADRLQSTSALYDHAVSKVLSEAIGPFRPRNLVSFSLVFGDARKRNTGQMRRSSAVQNV